MTYKTAAPGSIWTVPEAGEKALCLVVSPARGVSRGRPEHQVVPLYIPDPLVRVHSSADFSIRPDETTLGVGLHAALWNLRPLLLTDNGERVGEVTSPGVLGDLRDAYLRLADPAIEVRSGRLGTAIPSKAAEQWRAQEISAWQPLSGRVFGPFFATSVHAKLAAFGPWILTASDIDRLRESIEKTDDLLGSANLQSVGSTRVFLCANIALGVPQVLVTGQTTLFGALLSPQRWNGRFASTYFAVRDLSSKISIATTAADSKLVKVA